MQVVPYEPALESAWDEFCENSLNGTFLHSRRFLGYHGKRFEDLSVVLMDAGSTVGLFPAASAPGDPSAVVSHPGATYGGIVHQGRLTGSRMAAAMHALTEHYALTGARRLVYKLVPHIYARAPAQDDLYAIAQMGAIRVRCELSCAIELAHQRPRSERRRRGLKKAQKLVTLASEPTLVGDLWSVIAANLSREYGAVPVHSVDELALLASLFPGQVLIRCARIADRVEAGIVLFNLENVWHAQYIAASERGYEASALDAVFDAAIGEAQERGVRYFDFGTSNEDGGKILNAGLYQFKAEFGGGGVAYETYEIGLAR
jgi:CelD/BcsL family acetyltransferase involved in cellulose biosynthesis